ncbi:MAG: cytochrome c oxidase subunit 3 [Verrucomicrobia bacterium]|nr:cytochrome c oxidase subunit 3 [Verrucomicrobiota bacterium]
MSKNRAILYEHFSDIEQQRETSTAGIWVFIGSEIMFFGALILAFSVYRFSYAREFAEGAAELNLLLGGINTAILFTSGLTMSLAATANRMGWKGSTLILLLTTALLGVVFLGIKVFEYHEDWTKRLFPGPGFNWTDSDSPQVQLFFVLYFIMTGIHALHLIVGVGVVVVIAWLALRDRIHAGHFMPLDVAGLYWHFVDLVWVFLFALLYLMGGTR